MKNRYQTSNNKQLRNPSLKTLIICTFIWITGIVLLLMSTTDLFTETFFQEKNALISLLGISSISALVKLYARYWRNRSA